MPRASLNPREGFTLAEMIVALVLFALVGGALMAVIARQQRYYRSASELIETRSQIRQAISILPTELRGIYPRGGDVYAWSDSAIEIRANIGSAVLCVRTNSTTIILVPATLASGDRLAAWLTQPQVNDSLLVYDDGSEVGNADDVWRAHRVSAIVSLPGGCPTTTGLTAVADAAAPALQLTISPALTQTVLPGVPIRFFRRTRYRLYRASDNRWYLGAFDCIEGRAPQCATTQPVSGPYRRYSTAAGASGLSFLYFDQAGAVLTPGVSNPADIARIDVVARGETRAQGSLTGNPARAPMRDSLRFVVGLRNRL